MRKKHFEPNPDREAIGKLANMGRELIGEFLSVQNDVYLDKKVLYVNGERVETRTQQYFVRNDAHTLRKESYDHLINEGVSKVYFLSVPLNYKEYVDKLQGCIWELDLSHPKVQLIEDWNYSGDYWMEIFTRDQPAMRIVHTITDRTILAKLRSLAQKSNYNSLGRRRAA
jgi:hypothetical protein